MKSLERDKILERQKRQQYRAELDKVMMMKNEQSSVNKMTNQQIIRDDITNMRMNADREISNEIAYKNKFVKKDDVMKAR